MSPYCQTGRFAARRQKDFMAGNELRPYDDDGADVIGLKKVHVSFSAVRIPFSAVMGKG
jgi:hypothetical protein